MVRILLDDEFYLQQATVYGIVSELPDFRLSFLLNNDLGLKLTRNEKDRELYWKQRLYRYSEFGFEQAVSQIMWTLTANKGYLVNEEEDPNPLSAGSSLPLVSDLKAFDYFLWYDQEQHEEIEVNLNTRLKQVSYVRAFQKIDHSTSKHINNLLLEY